MRGLPRGVEPFLRWALPAEDVESFLGDLTQGYARKRARHGRIGAVAWLLRELATVRYVGLWRQAHRLRRERKGRFGDGTGRWVDMLGTDVRVALRSLLKRPAFSMVAILTLTLSVGAATLIFSVAEGVLLRPLPYPDSERIYQVFGTNRAWLESDQDILRQSWDQLGVSLPLLESWSPDGSVLADVSATMYRRLEMSAGGPPRMADGAYVVPGFFTLLGTRAVAGRLPTDEEVRDGDPVVVIRESMWRSDFGGDPDFIGSTLSLGDDVHTVVGIVPDELDVPSESTEWWAPLPSEIRSALQNSPQLDALVKTGAGATYETLLARLEQGPAALAEDDPAFADVGVRVVSLREAVVEDVTEGIGLLLAAVGLVVLIACVNLTTLVVARGARRRGEMAMRAALGASRRGLLTTLLSETLLLSVIGGGLGVLVALRLLDPFVALLESSNVGFPRTGNVEINLPVLLFALGVSVVTAVLAGTLPAWSASKQAPWQALQKSRRGGGGREVRRAQQGLVATEAALAIVLLAASSLLSLSYLNMVRVDPGFEAEGLAYVEITPPSDAYPEAEDAAALMGRIQERVAALPGVASVARAASLPGFGGTSMDLVRGGEQPEAEGALRITSRVGPDYFSTMGIPLRRGRGFTEADREDGEAVAVLSEALAREYFGEDDPLGKSVWIADGTRLQGGRTVAESETPHRVVGVVGDVRQMVLIREPDAMVYQPLAQQPSRARTLALRVTGDPADVLERVRAVALEADPDLLVGEMGSVDSAMFRVVAPIRVRMVLIMALGVLAVLLALVGIYGVVSYVVSDQTREIGIRRALGARELREIRRMVVLILAPTGVGIVVGLASALGLSRFLETYLFGLTPLDPWAYVSAVAAMSAMAALAAWLPARRAARVDPAEVLQPE